MNRDWLGPIEKAQMAGQDVNSRLDALELAVNQLRVPTISAPDMTAFSADLGTWTSGQLYYGTGDINDLTTLPTGLFIDATGVHIFSSGVEVGRFGNLNGFLTYIAVAYGIGIGDSKSYMTYDPLNGLRIKGTLGVFGVFPTFDAWDDTLLGTPDGVRLNFAFSNTPAEGRHVIQNGIWLQGGGNDYSTGGASTLYMIKAPQSVDSLRVSYIKASDLSSVYNETPSGTMNGVNLAFTVANTPLQGSFQVSLNGVELSIGVDYLDGVRTVLFNTAPQPGDLLEGAYWIVANIKHKIQEVPTGSINSSNTVFTTGSPYVPGTLIPVLNGIKQTITDDYTETGASQLTMVKAPQTGDKFWITYLAT